MEYSVKSTGEWPVFEGMKYRKKESPIEYGDIVVTGSQCMA